MKSRGFAVAIMSMFGGAQAFAQACITGSDLSFAAVTNLLRGRYACIGRSSNATWNELHSGAGTSGSLIDYKRGPGDATDPSATVGTCTVVAEGAGAQATGRITYNYGSGGSFSFHIRANLGSVDPGAGLCSFCAIGGAQNFAATVLASNC